MIYKDDLIKAALFNFVSLFFDHSGPADQDVNTALTQYEIIKLLMPNA